MFKTMMILLTNTLLLTHVALATDIPARGDRGNGGDFDEPTLYRSIEKIVSMTKEMERHKTSRDFADIGVLSSRELEKLIISRLLYIRIVEEFVTDTFGAIRSAVNFRPGELPNSYIKKHNLPFFFKDKYVILVNRQMYLEALTRNILLEELLVHEIYGLLNGDDHDYYFTRNFIRNFNSKFKVHANFREIIKCTDDSEVGFSYFLGNSTDSCMVIINQNSLKQQIWNSFFIGENNNGEIQINCAATSFSGNSPIISGAWGYKRGININDQEGTFEMYDYTNNTIVQSQGFNCKRM